MTTEQTATETNETTADDADRVDSVVTGDGAPGADAHGQGEQGDKWARFAKAMAEMKAKGVTPDDGEDEVFDPSAETKAEDPAPATAPAADAAPVAAAAEAPKDAAPPAADVVEEIIKAGEPAEEPKPASDGLAERYLDSPIDALKEAIKAWTGIDDDEELKTELKELIAEAGAHIHGVELDQSYSAKLMAKRARRVAQVTQKSVAKERASLEERSRQLAAKEDERRAVSALDQAIAGQREAFPWLASEENASELLFAVVKKQAAKDGKVPNWLDAAKKVDEYIKNRETKRFEKRRGLFVQSAPQPSEPKQGAPQGRGAKALTNSVVAKPVAKSTEAKPERPRTEEETRARSLARLRQYLSASNQHQ